MEYLKHIFNIVALILMFALGMPSVEAQVQGTLTLASSVAGTLAVNDRQIWSFNGVEGQVISISALATTPDFDPAISVTSSSGEVIISNDDYAYPDHRDAILEAMTLPRTDNYDVTVTSVGGMSGNYNLSLLPGFADLQDVQNFNGDIRWRGIGISRGSFALGNDQGTLTLSLEGPNDIEVVTNPQQLPFTDYFAQVSVKVVTGREGWIATLTGRQQENSDFYSLNINNQGQWQFKVQQNGESRTLRDWTTHPAIVGGKTDFTLGMLANGSGFDFFYDNVFFGRVIDSSLPAVGRIGLGVGTTSSLTSPVQVAFDDLTITAPHLVEGKRIIPQQLIIGSPAATIRELQRRGLVPPQGELALNVSESFVESQRPGVEDLWLARGSQFSTFVLASSLVRQAATEGTSGCGLTFHLEDDTHYTLAYIDQLGGYGVSQRVGDTFLPGIFGENPEIAGNTHKLMVIVQPDNLLFYIDGLYAGSSATEKLTGGVGNAVVNFDPVRTSCQFQETWVWNWEN
ncbi:MAG: hypothetical protein R3E39_02510 [Anaerolineae bacterium]